MPHATRAPQVRNFVVLGSPCPPVVPPFKPIVDPREASGPALLRMHLSCLPIWVDRCGRSGEIRSARPVRGLVRGRVLNCPDPNEIAAFLEGRLPRDEMERIEQHLDACSVCRQMVAFGGESQPSVPSTPSMAELEGESGALQIAPGAQLDNYLVIERLGEGGMGEVFLAKDAELGRRVAIKVIRSDRIGAPQEVDRFIREARVTARLNHPGIVTIYGIGRVGSTPYLALEYVEGETLSEHLANGPIEPKAWVPIARAVAEAAREAHRNLIVHGDLKPSNILLSSDGRVRTLDFGLARFIRSEVSLQTDVTVRAGGNPASATGIQGTPAYMAPEQWDAQAATPASDVWALGIIIFEMAVGRVPFSIAEVARLQADLPAACDEARRFGAKIPAVVEDLLSSCLDVEATQRPTMQQVVDALGMLERALELPSFSSGDLPWSPLDSVHPKPRWQGEAPSAGSGEPDVHTTQRSASHRGRTGVLVFLSAIVVAGGAAAGVWWSGMPRTASHQAQPSAVQAPGPSAMPVWEKDAGVDAVASSSASSRPRLAPTTTPTRSSPPAPPSTTAPASSSKPSLPSMRLAAIASLEDRAEQAASKGNHALARQLRGAADKHLNDVERNAQQMKAVEPVDAQVLLDYVAKARAYLAQRRAAAGGP